MFNSPDDGMYGIDRTWRNRQFFFFCFNKLVNQTLKSKERNALLFSLHFAKLLFLSQKAMAKNDFWHSNANNDDGEWTRAWERERRGKNVHRNSEESSFKIDFASAMTYHLNHTRYFWCQSRMTHDGDRWTRWTHHKQSRKLRFFSIKNAIEFRERQPENGRWKLLLKIAENDEKCVFLSHWVKNCIMSYNVCSLHLTVLLFWVGNRLKSENYLWREQKHMSKLKINVFFNYFFISHVQCLFGVFLLFRVKRNGVRGTRES